MKSRKQSGPPPVNIGTYLNDSTGELHTFLADPASNRVIADNDSKGRPIARILTTLPNWSSMTRPVDLQLLQMPRFPAPSNFEIAKKLLEAADRSNEITQTIFQSKSVSLLSYDFIKTNGHDQLYLTTAPESESQHAELASREQINREAEVIVEPRMHSHWRAARHFAIERGLLTTEESDPDMTPNVAVLAITQTGYGFAIGPVSNNTPVYAPEELADEQMLKMAQSLSAQALASSSIELLEEKMEPQALTHQRINARAEIAAFVTCDPQMWGHLKTHLRPTEQGLATPANIPLLPLNIEDANSDRPSDPATVAAFGAALGTLVPPEEIVNLADPLPARVDRIQRERDETDRKIARRRRTVAALILFALPLLIAGWKAGTWFSMSREVSELTSLKEQKQARSLELQAFIKKRNDANLNFAYCQDLAKQIFIQRAKQPAVAGLLVDLDYLWPASDQSWYVSGLAISPGGSGQIEIRGRSKTLDAFTEFTRALETLADERGNNKFTNIRPGTGEVGAGGSQASSPNIAIQQQPGQSAQQPGKPAGQGPFEWTVTATYLPLATTQKPQAAQPASPTQPAR